MLFETIKNWPQVDTWWYNEEVFSLSGRVTTSSTSVPELGFTTELLRKYRILCWGDDHSSIGLQVHSVNCLLHFLHFVMHKGYLTIADVIPVVKDSCLKGSIIMLLIANQGLHFHRCNLCGKLLSRRSFMKFGSTEKLF